MARTLRELGGYSQEANGWFLGFRTGAGLPSVPIGYTASRESAAALADIAALWLLQKMGRDVASASLNFAALAEEHALLDALRLALNWAAMTRVATMWVQTFWQRKGPALTAARTAALARQQHEVEQRRQQLQERRRQPTAGGGPSAAEPGGATAESSGAVSLLEAAPAAVAAAGTRRQPANTSGRRQAGAGNAAADGPLSKRPRLLEAVPAAATRALDPAAPAAAAAPCELPHSLAFPPRDQPTPLVHPAASTPRARLPLAHRQPPEQGPAAAAGVAAGEGPPAAAAKPLAAKAPPLEPGSRLACTNAPQPALPYPANWAPIAEWIIKGVEAELGQHAWVFVKPVNAKAVPDYYSVIKQPMCFKAVRDKLQRRQYASPQAFYSDVDLIWHNCFSYNQRGSEVHSLGLRGEERWLLEWGRSLFAAVPAQPRARPAAQTPAPMFVPAMEPSGGGEPGCSVAAPALAAAKREQEADQHFSDWQHSWRLQEGQRQLAGEGQNELQQEDVGAVGQQQLAEFFGLGSLLPLPLSSTAPSPAPLVPLASEPPAAHPVLQLEELLAAACARPDAAAAGLTREVAGAYLATATRGRDPGWADRDECVRMLLGMESVEGWGAAAAFMEAQALMAAALSRAA